MKTYVVCSGENGRCVIVGEAEAEPAHGAPCVLKNARMILYWSTECGGLLGLAANGPKTTTRITAAVAATETGIVKNWIEVAPEAIAAIGAWKAA